MAPALHSDTFGSALEYAAKRSINALSRRDLQNPNHTQQVTLGIIGVYVVVIAILWNVPYVRMVLWPFKVCQTKNSIK
jgi:hypothetical protein